MERYAKLINKGEPRLKTIKEEISYEKDHYINTTPSEDALNNKFIALEIVEEIDYKEEFIKYKILNDVLFSFSKYNEENIILEIIEEIDYKEEKKSIKL